MEIKWQSELATGNREVDNHHHDMFKKINDLVEACKERRSKPVIVDMVKFLNEYVETHFAAEEKLLSQSRHANVQDHLKQHEELRAKLRILTKEYTQEGTDLGVVTNTLKLTYNWLKDHIMTMDKEMIPKSATHDQ